MVSHDLLCLMVTNQIEFDQQESNLFLKIRTRDGPLLSGAGFQIENLRYHHFYLTELGKKLAIILLQRLKSVSSYRQK